jgi:hypothetical protein
MLSVVPKKNLHHAAMNCSLFVLVFYLLLVFFAPRLSGNFRFEDLLTPFLALLLIPAFNSKIFINSTTIFIYFFYSLAITLIYIINGTLTYDALFIWGKEFQYLLIFLTTLCLCRYSYYKHQIYNTIKVGILAACLFGAWEAISGNQSYYGIGYINDYSSTISSVMYFSFTILSLILYEKEKKTRYIFSALICFILVILVGARTAQAALIIFMAIYLYKNNIYGLFFVLCFALTVLTLTIFSEPLLNFFYNIDTSNTAVDGGISRMSTMLTPIETLTASRGNSWGLMLNEGFSRSPFFGCGRGCSHIDPSAEITMPLGLGGDNQYLVNFVDLGIFGSILFLVAIFAQLFRVTTFRKIYLAFFVSYFASGFAIEIWQLSRGGLFFWLITALLISENNIYTSLRK